MIKYERIVRFKSFGKQEFMYGSIIESIGHFFSKIFKKASHGGDFLQNLGNRMGKMSVFG